MHQALLLECSGMFTLNRLYFNLIYNLSSVKRKMFIFRMKYHKMNFEVLGLTNLECHCSCELACEVLMPVAKTEAVYIRLSDGWGSFHRPRRPKLNPLLLFIPWELFEFQ